LVRIELGDTDVIEIPAILLALADEVIE